jgi:hypothetical protein
MPAVSAEAPKQPMKAPAQEPIKAPEAAQAQPAAPAAGDAANAAQSSSCIDLVAAGDFEGALPVCLQAASIDPENAEVQAALAKAKAETAAKAATGSAAGAAADSLRGINN